jgi:hypothetical protein
MKRILLSLSLTALLSASLPALARNNPAVQPIFFEHLQAALSTSEPAPTIQSGTVTEVTLSSLAWAVDNVKNDPVPLVIEFYSSNQNDCAISPQTTDNECALQETATPAAAAQYPGRVRFLRIDVNQYPILLNGPDVRVLPSHIVVSAYTDTTHYTASKVAGYLDEAGLESLIKADLAIDP